jgi:hypothetical protein
MPGDLSNTSSSFSAQSLNIQACAAHAASILTQTCCFCAVCMHALSSKLLAECAPHILEQPPQGLPAQNIGLGLFPKWQVRCRALQFVFFCCSSEARAMRHCCM